MPNSQTITIHNPSDIGQRIDSFINGKVESLSRSQIKELLLGENILVNDKPVKAKYKIALSDIIKITIPDIKPLEIKAPNTPLTILFLATSNGDDAHGETKN